MYLRFARLSLRFTIPLSSNLSLTIRRQPLECVHFQFKTLTEKQ